MNPLDFFFYFAAVFVGALIALTLGRALAARIAGPHAALVLGGPIISITFALPHSREREEDQESEIDTGNTDTPENTKETAGNTEETPGDMLPLVVNHSGDQHLVPRMTREEYHELIEIRVKVIDLLQKCLDYYRETGEPDKGVIPRWNKIHMQSEDRGKYVDALWYSGYVIKSSKGTLIDQAYYPTCAALLQAVKDNQIRVYPYGWAQRKQKRHMDAAMALPENKRDD